MILDHLLAMLLLLAVPARAIWRERGDGSASRSKMQRYRSTIGTIAGLLALLAIDWMMTGRSAAALGLAAPVRPLPAALLIVAIGMIAALAVAVRRRPRAADGPQRAAMEQIAPGTPVERRLFAAMALCVGFGWEALYRGFLLFYLRPLIGTVAAVAVAASAYGLAHGVRQPRRLAGSLAAALAFTIAYALTDSLWWLAVLHAGLPLTMLVRTREPMMSGDRGVGAPA